jgi:hypothetical protein
MEGGRNEERIEAEEGGRNEEGSWREMERHEIG